MTQVLEKGSSGGTKLGIEDIERLESDAVSLPAQELTGLLREAAADHPAEVSASKKIPTQR